MFVRAPNPIWFMVDHTGEPLNDEYYAFFLTNTLPYLPQNVYRDPQGQTVWTNDIVQFSPAGTLPDNLYFDPNLVYRIEIRHGNSQMDELIWEINNFVPGEGGGNVNSLAILGNDNQISNPQFSLINFTDPLVITVAGSYNIAPGWFIDLVGSGTMTITRNVLDGNQNIINNPPYSLRFNSNGWTSAILRQRFEHNGAIWASGAITMQLTGRAQTTSELVSLVYSPSSPGVPQVVASGTLTTGDYQVLQGAIDLPSSVNTTLSDTAYTDMLVELPATGIVDITNIQVIGQGDPLPSDFDPSTDIPVYQQQSEEREIDHLFHYYKDAVVQQPKSDILAGWVFAYNPWHFTSPTLTNVANNTYTADQTIIIQQAYVTSATGNNVQVGRASAADNFNFQIKAVTAANKVMMLQYIDPLIMRPYWNKKLSVMMRASITTSNATQLQFKVRLMYKAGLPGTISQTNPVSVWANTDGAIPTISGDSWTFIESINDPTYTLTSDIQNFAFDSFQLPVSAGSQMTLGVAFIMMNNMVQTGTPDVINVESISLVENDFAIQGNDITYADAVRKCQFYFEYSYDPESPIGLNTLTGALTAQEPLLSSTAPGLQSFFKSLKRANAAVTWYSPVSGTPNTIRDQTVNVDYTVVSTSNNSATITGYPVISGDIPDGNTVAGQWTADARLGL